MQVRWLAQRLAAWIRTKAEVRHSVGGVPQGALVVRDPAGAARHVIFGAWAFSTAGLGTTAGNQLSLIQSSETDEDAKLVGDWFDSQWSGLAADGNAKAEFIMALESFAAHREGGVGIWMRSA